MEITLGPGHLRADLLPTTTWGSNLRGVLTAAQWDTLRIPVCTAADDRCEVCGARGRRRPDCHEQWTFDQHVQRLTRLIALCPDCHRVQHAGLAAVRGETHLVLAKLREVNTWTLPRAESELDRAWAQYHRRERQQWDLDLTALSGVIDLPALYIKAEDRQNR